MNRREFIQAGSGVLGAALFSTGAVGQGDLNHRPDGPEYGRWREAGLVDAYRRDGETSEFTFPSTTPRQCIDYIWSNAVLARRGSAARVLFEGPFRTNPEDPRSFALSDHLPVLADFGG